MGRQWLGVLVSNDVQRYCLGSHVQSCKYFLVEYQNQEGLLHYFDRPFDVLVPINLRVTVTRKKLLPSHGWTYRFDIFNIFNYIASVVFIRSTPVYQNKEIALQTCG